jgi:drug/metabolite transporter (DMT)-like permease
VPELRQVRRIFTDSRPSNLRGIGFMLAATLLFSGMAAVARLVTERIHPFEVTFFRIAFGVLVLAPLLLRYGLAPFRTRKLGLHLARAVTHVAEMLMYFVGLGMIAFAKVQALSFTTPIFASVLAVLVLRERVFHHRVAGLLLGFIGALVVIQPGAGALDTGTVLIISAAMGWACVILMVKRLTHTDSSLTITVWMVVLMSPIALVPALFVWEWPSPSDLGLLALVGVTGTLGQLAVTQAFRLADTTTVLPFDFTKLLWASLLGFLVFGEVPTVWTWLGGALIFGGGLYIAYAERYHSNAFPTASSTNRE